MEVGRNFSIVEHKDFKSYLDFVIRSAIFSSKMIYCYIFIFLQSVYIYKQGYFYASVFLALFLLFAIIYRVYRFSSYWNGKISVTNKSIQFNGVEIKIGEIEDVIKVESDNCLILMRTKFPDCKRLYHIYNSEAFESVYSWLHQQGMNEITSCSNILSYFGHKSKKVEINALITIS